ncbi:bifunctional precorrin-2 dehydrogenase/sirohydrochlorin ferrochelatase [Deinococcus sp. KNUC1210]|uniref:precorrin-2 dehydrogenase/sirohydrochlorin ferrochelatase family protein n=1 Tax=Deinococcus sp. KNUC1210 TaxID=2917691 RepID=UPI001EF157FC|nr:NAD(P)-dependent oxidoreductase [Deinococcus sp. KNUC1210]ULH15309.1 bifunctional precorrin-2 dehydrogenase/sirohydrochlorin ferrochelatase [Deinococcus sp. KNUC1210]
MLLAAFLNFQDAQAVVVGGGVVAARRIGTLLHAGLRVTVIAPAISPGVRAQDVAVIERPYLETDLEGARLVLACTDNPDINDRVTADALKRGLLVGHAGNAALGNLRFPAVIGRGSVQIAVNTGRELPMLAQALTERLETALPDTLPLDAWMDRRSAALRLNGAERETALKHLRTDIRRHFLLEADAQELSA